MAIRPDEIRSFREKLVTDPQKTIDASLRMNWEKENPERVMRFPLWENQVPFIPDDAGMRGSALQELRNIYSDSGWKVEACTGRTESQPVMRVFTLAIRKHH